MHIKVFVELNEIFLTLLLGGTNDIEKNIIQEGQRGSSWFSFPESL